MKQQELCKIINLFEITLYMSDEYNAIYVQYINIQFENLNKFT